jgi:hypothetical protein
MKAARLYKHFTDRAPLGPGIILSEEQVDEMGGLDISSHLHVVDIPTSQDAAEPERPSVRVGTADPVQPRAALRGFRQLPRAPSDQRVGSLG